MTRLANRVSALENGGTNLRVGELLDMLDAGVDLTQPAAWPAPYTNRLISPALHAALEEIE